MNELWSVLRSDSRDGPPVYNETATICMGPNLTHQDRFLNIAIENEIESLNLCYTQKATEGFVVDRIEWDGQAGCNDPACSD